jgi:CheY-like chemotaxis protein
MNSILVVDDELLVAEMLAELLQDEGYAVTTAAHGKHALERVRQQHPDLIVTDFMMPLMNGLELAQTLRADPATAGIPIVLVSGGQGQIARQHPEAFDIVLNKPCEVDHLLAAIRRLLAEGRA